MNHFIQSHQIKKVEIKEQEVQIQSHAHAFHHKTLEKVGSNFAIKLQF